MTDLIPTIDFQRMADLIEQEQDDMQQWEKLYPKVKLHIVIMANRAYGVIPTEYLTISEYHLFKASYRKKDNSCVIVPLEIGENFNFFIFLCTAKAQDKLAVKSYYK